MSQILLEPAVWAGGSINAPTRRFAMDEFSRLVEEDVVDYIVSGDWEFASGWITPRQRSTFGLKGMHQTNNAVLGLGFDGSFPEYRFDHEEAGGGLVISPVILGYYGEALATVPHKQRLEEQYKVELDYQAGIIYPGDLARMTLGEGWVANRDLFQSFINPTTSELNSILQLYGNENVVVSLEMPATTLTLYATAPELQAERAEQLAQEIAHVLSQLPKGIRVKFHICFGDLEGESWLIRMLRQKLDLRGVVKLANAIAAVERDGWTLEGIQIPMTTGDAPIFSPGESRQIFSALEGLVRGPRIYAGVVQPGKSLDYNRSRLQLARDIYGEPFAAVGTPCGWARTSEVIQSEVIGQLVTIAKSSA